MQVQPLQTDMLGYVTLHKGFDLSLPQFPISKIIYLCCGVNESAQAQQFRWSLAWC